MSLLSRVYQKVFAGGVSATNNIAVFGSTKTGSPTYSDDLATIQGLSAWAGGFGSATVGTQSPVMQEVNAIFRVFSQQIAYILQRGVPEWDASTDYYAGCIVSSSGALYKCLATCTGVTVSNTNYWQNMLGAVSSALPSSQQLASGWVIFSRTGSILRSYNVSSVSRTAPGYYIVRWATALSAGSYCVAATCGGADYGDDKSADNYVCISDEPSPMTSTYVKLRVNQTAGETEDASLVSVVAYA